MKKLIGLTTIIAILLLCAAAAAEVPIDAKHFPDEAFRASVAEFDFNEDGVLQDDEIEGITGMDCSERGIASLKGIEYLTALEGFNAHDNQITEADFSKNQDIKYITLYSNQLQSINVSKNAKLLELGVSNNKLTSLTLPKSKGLYVLDATSNNGIRELDISKNPLLAEAVRRVEPTDYIYWDGGYAMNWIIDEPDLYVFFAVDKWVKVKANGETVVDPTDVTEFKYGGLRYSLNKKKKTAAVSGVTDKKVTSLTVMDVIELSSVTYKVTGIEDGALKGLKKLKSLTIGKNVKTIGKDACNGCKKLKVVTFLGTKVKTIGSGAFKGTPKATYKCPAKKLSKYQKMLLKAGAAKGSKFVEQ